jgi:hypothetical protein
VLLSNFLMALSGEWGTGSGEWGKRGYLLANSLIRKRHISLLLPIPNSLFPTPLFNSGAEFACGYDCAARAVREALFGEQFQT